MRTVKAKARGAWSMTRHPVETGKLIEIGPTSKVWRSISEAKSLPVHAVEGGIFKLVPPAGVSVEVADALAAHLYALGARAVRRMPSPPDDKVTVSKEPAKTDVRSLRQVVMDRLARASVMSDVDELKALVNEAMDQGES